MVGIDADPDYSAFCAGALQDPYPFFNRLRSEDPVHWSAALNAWVLTRDDDIFGALSDPRVGYERIGALMNPVDPQGRVSLKPLEEHIGHWLGFTDPPRHTRLRAIVGRMFTPRLARAMTPRVQDTVDSLLDEVDAGEGFDVMTDLASKPPERLIYNLMDLPLDMRARFRQLVDCIGAFVGNMGPGLDAAADDANAATLEHLAYFRALATERARHPGQDLVSELAVLEASGELTEQELLGLCVFVFAAGQTPFRFIATAMYLLLDRPEAADAWRADTTIAASGIEESLRYEAPLQIVTTVALIPLEIRGRSIEKGDLLVLCLAAGNRDPETFVDPDRLDLRRQPNRHLSFGWGAHYCLGAPLTRVEAEIAIGTTLRRIPGLRLASERAEWTQSQTERRLASLPVNIGPDRPRPLTIGLAKG
jgi:pimeloyl-[acyl-carrier protein] synthase